ncbi:protein of unknown function (DUF916) [Promicromonospora umidemergens]|uniref:DUF916 domain-containing protein n=1 Tax=Promicromonospora umidemergens TaxID=629679 RepID=A0ABP8Y0P5_9MICO|nr:DUF916 domain-containing protein [Promicromonospora umidemergens]MCP2284204.1 protein of unknown function (DUF916) [Promicromonospora umidemergens]
MFVFSVVRGVVGLVAAVLVVTAVPVSAPAQAADDDRVTWSVVPADASGPDGRRVVDLELEPGERATERVAVTNHSADEVTFALSANDGYLTERGSFDMRPSAVPPTDGGAWITVPSEVVVGPGETEVVPFEVTSPADAVPGDHPAGVAASVLSGGEMQVESRVGVRVNLRTPGEVVASMDAKLLDTSFTQGRGLLEPGELVVRYAVVNDGAVALRTTSQVRAESTFGGPAAAAPTGETLEVLPGGRREVTVTVRGVWPVGPFGVEAVVSAAMAEGGPDVPVPADVTLADTAWALPLPHLLVLLALTLVAWAVRRALRVRRARLDRLLERARAEGRAEAMAPAG